MGLLNQPRLARTAKQGLMSPLEIQMDTMVNDPLRPNLSSRLTQQDLINKGLMAIGMAPMGITKAKTAYELAHDVASKNAEKMLGLPKGNTAADRAKALGFDATGYHGTGQDIKEFLPKQYKKGASKTMRYDIGTHISHDPENANLYAKAASMGNEFGDKYLRGLSNNAVTEGNATVYPLIMRGKTLDTTKPFNDEVLEKILKKGDEYFSPTRKRTSVMLAEIEPSNLLSELQPKMGRPKFEKFIRNELGFENVAYPWNGTNTVTTNPANIRSRFAAFDPARAHESDLLAGLAPYLGIGGLLSLGLLTPEEAQAK